MFQVRNHGRVWSPSWRYMTRNTTNDGFTNGHTPKFHLGMRTLYGIWYISLSSFLPRSFAYKMTVRGVCSAILYIPTILHLRIGSTCNSWSILLLLQPILFTHLLYSHSPLGNRLCGMVAYLRTPRGPALWVFGSFPCREEAEEGGREGAVVAEGIENCSWHSCHTGVRRNTVCADQCYLRV